MYSLKILSDVIFWRQLQYIADDGYEKENWVAAQSIMHKMIEFMQETFQTYFY